MAAPEIEFAPRRGLLVPVDALAGVDVEPARVAELPAVVVQESTDVDLVPAVDAPVDGRPDALEAAPRRRGGGRGPETAEAEQMRRRLAGKRGRVSVRREDELEREEERTDHELALAKVRNRAASKRRAQAERVRDEKQDAELAELYRRAARDGTRARIRADIQRSAEMRALRVETVRRSAFVVGLPVLIGFAAWSTPGVQSGAVRLLNADQGDPLWWAAWLVEPLLIGVAAWIITIKSLLKNAGGDTDGKANRAKWGALVVSVALNMSGGWHGGGGVVAAIGEALVHSIGAIGAAVTAWLIGVVIDYASKAKPWDGATRLADMGVLPPSGGGRPDGRPDAINLPERGDEAPVADDLPDDVRTLLADVRAAIVRGDLPVDPSGYAIYRRVMGGRGDKGRAYRVADLVTGWRPTLRAVSR